MNEADTRTVLAGLPPDWGVTTLDSFIEKDGLSYGIVQPGARVDQGVPVVRVGDIRGGRIATVGVVNVSAEVEAHYKRTRLQGGEVLLSVVGSVGQVAVVPANLAGWNVARAVAVIRPKDEGQALWLKYCLESPVAQHYMRMWQTTTVQATLNLRDVRRLPIPVAPLATQAAIVELLGTIDDKIEVNLHVSFLADSTWRASSADCGGDGSSRLLSTLGRFVNGKAFTKDATGDGRMVIRIAELNAGPGPSTVYNRIDVSRDNLAVAGDLLFAWSGSLTVSRWFRSEAIVNQHIFKVLPAPGVPVWFLHGRLLDLLPHFRAVAAGKATTMGHIQRHHLDEPVLVPTPERLLELDRVCLPLWQRALAAERENLVLVQLRDTLLPRLLSGELRFADAEMLADAAT